MIRSLVLKSRLIYQRPLGVEIDEKLKTDPHQEVVVGGNTLLPHLHRE